MAVDLSLPFRGAVVKALRSYPALAELVGQRVHAEQPPEPQTPWIRCGRISALPFQASGAEGSEISLTLHGFATGSVEAHRLGNLIVYALDEKRLAIEPDQAGDPQPYAFDVLWAGSEVMPDTASKGDYHAVVRFTAVVALET